MRMVDRLSRARAAAPWLAPTTPACRSAAARNHLSELASSFSRTASSVKNCASRQRVLPQPSLNKTSAVEMSSGARLSWMPIKSQWAMLQINAAWAASIQRACSAMGVVRQNGGCIVCLSHGVPPVRLLVRLHALLLTGHAADFVWGRCYGAERTRHAGLTTMAFR